MDLGKMLEEVLERHGFAMPSGSGVARRELSDAAEEFLRAVREAEATGAANPVGEGAGPASGSGPQQ
jgi:hypothetical protein